MNLQPESAKQNKRSKTENLDAKKELEAKFTKKIWAKKFPKFDESKVFLNQSKINF
jgi:hypothetical protein